MAFREVTMLKVTSAQGMYAGLGRRSDAMAEAKRGMELLPVSQDALFGPYRDEDLARVYTMVGEYDATLDQIERLLSIPAFSR